MAGLNSHSAPEPLPAAEARTVRCPQCGGDSVFAPSNPARPFCSPRCKAVDLGAWASESFRIAAVQDPDGDAQADSAAA